MADQRHLGQMTIMSIAREQKASMLARQRSNPDVINGDGRPGTAQPLKKLPIYMARVIIEINNLNARSLQELCNRPFVLRRSRCDRKSRTQLAQHDNWNADPNSCADGF